MAMTTTSNPGVAPVVSAQSAVSQSAVSWGAVFGGAAVATAVTVMLTALGTGIGFASVSPFSGNNPSVTTFTVLAAVWMIVVQWLSSGIGGYLTGRLRTKWMTLHTGEVLFRDTANGFITWAVASLVVVGFAGSLVTATVSGAGQVAGRAASHAAGGVAQGAAQSSHDQNGYMLDMLFRPAQPNSAAPAPEARAEAARILATGFTGDVSPQDRAYLAQMVAARTGLTQQDATQRVNDVIGKEQEAAQKAKQAANVARKATSRFMLYSFFSMLVGAFIACVAAALGGRQRDSV